VNGARNAASAIGSEGPQDRPSGLGSNPGREFAFRRTGPGMGEIIWRYRIEPSAAGATLTESYEEVKPAARFVIWLTTTMTGIDDLTADLQRGMEDTLGRMKAVAEPSK